MDVHHLQTLCDHVCVDEDGMNEANSGKLINGGTYYNQLQLT